MLQFSAFLGVHKGLKLFWNHFVIAIMLFAPICAHALSPHPWLLFCTLFLERASSLRVHGTYLGLILSNKWWFETSCIDQYIEKHHRTAFFLIYSTNKSWNFLIIFKWNLILRCIQENNFFSSFRSQEFNYFLFLRTFRLLSRKLSTPHHYLYTTGAYQKMMVYNSFIC